MAKTKQNEVNLMPAKLLDRLEKQQLLSCWTKIMLALVLLSGAVVAFSGLQASSNRKEIKLLESQIQLPKQLIAENRRLRSELQHDKGQRERVRSLTTQHSPLVLMALATKVKSEIEGKLTLEQFQQSAIENSNNKVRGSVSLTLVTNSAANSAKIVKLFEQSGYFREVRLVGAVEKTQMMQEDLRFTLTCSY